jgi:hypothetical protein
VLAVAQWSCAGSEDPLILQALSLLGWLKVGIISHYSTAKAAKAGSIIKVSSRFRWRTFVAVQDANSLEVAVPSVGPLTPAKMVMTSAEGSLKPSKVPLEQLR